MLTPDMLASLPNGVVHPLAQPNEHTAGLTAYDLSEEVNSSPRWQSSAAYAEVAYWLLTCTVEELEEAGQFVPCWKAA